MKTACVRIAILLLPAVAASVAPLTSGRDQSASDSPATLMYRRVFKGSVPEFIEVRVTQAGKATYDIRSLQEEPDPQPLEVSDALVAKIFELAGKLNNFQNQQLDVKRRLANLGEKTFRFERGTEAYEATFNYTISPPATQLMMIYEGLARQQEHLETLERRLKYDRLGLQKAILSFETDLNRKILPEPQRLVPVLEKIAADEKVVEIARQRARSLAERLRATS
jgi:hypothetical protein